MSVERLLQLSIAVLITLGALLRSPGQRDLILPALLLTAALVSIYVTDYKRWFRLSHRVANVAALVSVVFALHNFFGLDSAAQLSAIARLLTYLQLTLLFQEKNARLYWQFFALSVLQVVVGAALNVSMVFGVLLIVYLFVGLYALSLFYVYREQGAVAQPRLAPVVVTPGAFSSPAAPAAQLRPPSRVGAGPFSSGPSRGPAPSRDIRQSFTRAGFLAAGSLAMTVVLFVLAPRSGKTDWTSVTDVGVNPMTGFTPDVKLGDMGTITQNSQPVMRVKLTDETGAAVSLVDQPLLRGSLLNFYSKGSWSYHTPRLPRRTPPWKVPAAKEGQYYVRQEITIEPAAESILFSIYPPLYIESNSRVQFDPGRMRFNRSQRVSDQRFSYVLGTTGIYRDRQWPVVPQFGPADGPEGGQTRDYDPDEDQPGEIKPIADRVLREANVAAGDRVAQCNALLSYLRDSGKFEYSLESSARNPNVDPIVDFLQTNRRGHCEYFASAMCLLLRSQKIPARIVAGFYGDWNPMTQDYIVRQMHAHTWVEAYLEPEQIPAELQPPEAPITGGGWLTLDPTPGVGTDPAARHSMLGPLANAVDYTQIMWTTYVVGMTKSFQYDTFYEPVLQWVTGTFKWGASLVADAADAFWQWLSADWFGWRGLVTLIGLAVVAAALVRAVLLTQRWRARRALRSLLDGRPLAERAAIEFYRRLEDLLARLGLARAAGQTPREFAVSIGPDLARLCAPGAPAQEPRWSVADVPRQVVDVFYRIRFGGRQLSRDERETIEQSLEALEHSIDRRETPARRAP